MINLLPTDVKKGMVYARRNRALIKWMVAMFVGIAGIGAVVLAGHFYINIQTKAYEGEVKRSQASLEKQSLAKTQERITEINNSVNLALQVLSREVLFSKLLKGIGGVMPPGASLQNLSISDVEGALDLQVLATDFQTATQVQVNLQDPSNQVFEKADIINIGCNPQDEDGPTVAYPCQVNIRALFAQDSPFLFSSSTDGGGQ